MYKQNETVKDRDRYERNESQASEPWMAPSEADSTHCQKRALQVVNGEM